MIHAAILALVLHFTPVAGNRMEVTMNVDADKIRMIVDTGAQVSVFRHLHGDVGMAADIRLAGAAGQAFAKKCEVRIEKLKVTALCAVNLPDNQEGLLGSDFLSQYSSVVINYKTKTIELIP